MYVCVCKAISDRRIREAVDAGACTVRDLSRSLGLGTGCGKCVPAARELLSESVAANGQQMPVGKFLEIPSAATVCTASR